MFTFGVFADVFGIVFDFEPGHGLGVFGVLIDEPRPTTGVRDVVGAEFKTLWHWKFWCGFISRIDEGLVVIDL